MTLFLKKGGKHMSELPRSVMIALDNHLQLMKTGKVKCKKYIDPKEFTLSKYLRNVYASYSYVHNWISYETYLKLLIEYGCIDSDQLYLVHKDKDYCQTPLTNCEFVP